MFFSLDKWVPIIGFEEEFNSCLAAYRLCEVVHCCICLFVVFRYNSSQSGFVTFMFTEVVCYAL